MRELYQNYYDYGVGDHGVDGHGVHQTLWSALRTNFVLVIKDFTHILSAYHTPLLLLTECSLKQSPLKKTYNIRGIGTRSYKSNTDDLGVVRSYRTKYCYLGE